MMERGKKYWCTTLLSHYMVYTDLDSDGEVQCVRWYEDEYLQMHGDEVRYDSMKAQRRIKELMVLIVKMKVVKLS